MMDPAQACKVGSLLLIWFLFCLFSIEMCSYSDHLFPVIVKRKAEWTLLLWVVVFIIVIIIIIVYAICMKALTTFDQRKTGKEYAHCILLHLDVKKISNMSLQFMKIVRVLLRFPPDQISHTKKQKKNTPNCLIFAKMAKNYVEPNPSTTSFENRSTHSTCNVHPFEIYMVSIANEM